MTIRQLLFIVNSGEVAILDSNISAPLYWWYQDNASQPVCQDWVFQDDTEDAGVFWVYNEKLRSKQ